MKKIKYYAPYWVSAIVIIALILLITNLRKPLDEYALSMESSDYFIRNDHSIWKLSRSEDNGVIVIEPTGQTARRIKNYAGDEPLSDMSLAEFALSTQSPVFIRQDGSLWYPIIDSHICYIISLEKADYDFTSVSSPELATSLKPSLDRMVQLSIFNSGDVAIPSPYAYLFVQLEDGCWYPYQFGSDHHISIRRQYYWGMYMDADTSLEPGSKAVRIIAFPLNILTKRIPLGHYCIGIFSNAYYDGERLTYDMEYTTYPLSEDAELIATIEFDITEKNDVDFKMTNFKSSIEDLKFD